MEPFLKWAGGKRWLIPRLVPELPNFRKYFEPFLGSGALFFALEPKCAILSDTNRELINCYRRVKYDCRQIVKILKNLQINQTTYYRIRDDLYCKADKIKRAAYFIYLNQMCWNGLYRVNASGKFNVPVGIINKNKTIFNEERLLSASRLLKRAKIKCCDFEDALSEVRTKDLVYFDPPYITTHLNNGFIEYNSKLFHPSDELRLANKSYRLAMKGTYVMVSNAAHPIIKQQYDGPFYKLELNRSSCIAADATKRKPFRELIVTNFELRFPLKS
jgi:DNA adenine methylase